MEHPISKGLHVELAVITAQVAHRQTFSIIPPDEAKSIDPHKILNIYTAQVKLCALNNPMKTELRSQFSMLYFQ